MCPFNNMERWVEIYKKHPELYRHAIAIEENGKHFGRQGLAPKGHTLRGNGRDYEKKAEAANGSSRQPMRQ